MKTLITALLGASMLVPAAAQAQRLERSDTEEHGERPSPPDRPEAPVRAAPVAREDGGGFRAERHDDDGGARARPAADDSAPRPPREGGFRPAPSAGEPGPVRGGGDRPGVGAALDRPSGRTDGAGRPVDAPQRVDRGAFGRDGSDRGGSDWGGSDRGGRGFGGAASNGGWRGGPPAAGRPGDDPRNGRNETRDGPRGEVGRDGRWNGRDDRRDAARARPAPGWQGSGWPEGNWRSPGNDRGRYDGNRRDNWNRSWRNDRRYDWNRYRNTNRGQYRLPRYYAPYGWSYGYRRFSIGVTLSAILWNRDYWIDDPWAYRLPEAYGPYRWVRYYDDALLIDIRTGQVVDVVHDIFW